MVSLDAASVAGRANALVPNERAKITFLFSVESDNGPVAGGASFVASGAGGFFGRLLGASRRPACWGPLPGLLQPFSSVSPFSCFVGLSHSGLSGSLGLLGPRAPGAFRGPFWFAR